MFKDNFKVNIFYKKRVKIKLIRPLLELKRFEILKLCNFWSLPICIDSTNILFSFKRNRIRHQVFPILRIFFNPKLDDSLSKFIETSAFEDYSMIRQFLPKNILVACSKKRKESKIVLKWVFYTPINIHKKFYYHLFSNYFKNLTFQEIFYLIKLRNVYYK